MSLYFVNFIKKGDPNGNDVDGSALPMWKPYTESSKNEMHFTPEGAKTKIQEEKILQRRKNKIIQRLIKVNQSNNLSQNNNRMKIKIKMKINKMKISQMKIKPNKPNNRKPLSKINKIQKELIMLNKKNRNNRVKLQKRNKSLKKEKK